MTLNKVAVSSPANAETAGKMASFAVSRAHRQLIEANRPKIEAKFRVSVQLNSYAEPTGGQDTYFISSGDDEPDSLPCHVIIDDGLGQMWVEIDGCEAIPAKDHIISLCHDLQVKEELPPGFGDFIACKLDGIATETGTRISRIEGTDTVILSGCDETSLAIACSMITEKCNILRRCQESSRLSHREDLRTKVHVLSDYYLDNRASTRLCSESLQRNSPTDRPLNSDESIVSVSPRFHSASPKRSAPDSTFTPEPDLYGASSAFDMGRTTEERESPRLIAHSLALPDPAAVAPQDAVSLADVQPRDSRALSLVNSMQKLGFSKDQVDLILRQLGPTADHNDVLGALVNQRPAKTDLEEAGEAEREEEVARVKDISDGFPSVEGAEDDSNNLRPVIIDGSNVAMSFGNKDVFACKGIEIVVNWFYERGHRNILIFVPAWRKEASKPDTPITDQGILTDLEKRSFLVWTPSRRINGRRIVCYDDRYILKTAVEEDGIIVSNDNFRDIQNERAEWRKVIEERLLMYSFVNDRFMPPDDPLGRHGPSLDNFLRMKPTMPDHLPQACPYGKKCTYGNKCKYYHADRPNRQMKSISETLKERDKNRKERAKLNSDRGNSPRFTSVSSAPIPGYVPPEDTGTSPEWHTTPLPGPTQQPLPSKHGRIASESSALQMSPRQSGSPRHVYATEPASQSPYLSPREELYGMPDIQQYTGVSPMHNPVPSQPMNASPIGRASHSAPLPAYTKHSERPTQRDMFTVPLQRYPSQSDRGYAQVEESHMRNRMSMPPVLYGSGEALSVTPPGVNFERRASPNDLLADMQRMGIHEQSGMPLSREPQPNYGYRQSPQQYHSKEAFPGQPLPSQRPEETNQSVGQHMAYHSGESFMPRRPVTSDSMRYPPPVQTAPPGYHPSHSQQQPRPYYGNNPSPVSGAGGWQGSIARPAAAAPDHGAATRRAPEASKSLEDQRKNIMHHLSSHFGREQAKAVMQRHPHETNPNRLVMYMSTNT